ncbi:MucB/RseB C-terminal domain-containing protein [Marinobacter subterrani]|uniref:Sigma E regulatory protein, MucB/RseB n=1 Tax=Marinobacter subterrani TaxID=1658765 RepID=A0A0J7JB95_9GAMM|nr:MucB/RseB C-terminal domain-containing protein [Marinobacter subterrani]KMQ75184.1 sigma E regulatory protein, MucB/RseB [Marinobacter subterrani]
MRSPLNAVARSRSVSLWVVLVLALAGSLPVAAEGDEAAAWLKRLGPALNMTSYRGVFVYARGDSVHSMQIAHRYHKGVVEERLVLQDGGSGEILRKGVNVVCVLPETGAIKLDQVIPLGPFADAFAGQWVPVRRWYRAEMKGEGRVAGYDVVSLALSARDSFRYSYRLWLEKSSGLLVKSQVSNAEGDVLEHFQFTSLQIGGDIPDSEFEIRTEGREVSGTLNSPPSRASTVQHMKGWQLGWRPDGFMPAAAPGPGKGQAVAFSDGLAAFSVFVEPADELNMPTGASRIGATTVYMHKVRKSGSAFLVTVVGELPPKTARRVAESVRIENELALRAGGS